MSASDRQQARKAATTDPRAERTREAILWAFYEVMLQDGFDAATPAKIAARAKVGRSTFYQHFRGREELLAHSFRGQMDELAKFSLRPEADARMQKLLEHFWQNRNMARTLLAGRSGAAITNVLAGSFARALECSPAKTTRAQAINATYLAAGHIATLREWLTGKLLLSADELANELRTKSLGLIGARV
jgi:AcrR family transcriptional regulator